jgi:hypothetical protein
MRSGELVRVRTGFRQRGSIIAYKNDGIVLNLWKDGRIIFSMFAVTVGIPVYWKNDDDDDLCHADCSLISGMSLTASRKKKNNLVPLL